MDKIFIRPDVRELLDMIARIGGKQMHEVSPVEARLMFRKMAQIADAAPVELPTIRDLSCPGPAGDIPLRLYDRRDSRGTTPVILFMHGGGFVVGDLESHNSFCTLLADRLDMPVLAVDYRLAPEHPFPAAPDDCVAAARWVASSPAELPFKVSGIIPCGDSAGGNLTTVVALALTRTPAAAPLLAQFPIYPAVDTQNRYPSMRSFADGYLLSRKSVIWFGQHYGATVDVERHDTLHADPAGLPPTLVVTASLDPLLDQGRAYRDRLAAAQVPVRYYEAEGNIHGFITLRGLTPSSAADVERIIDEMKEIIAQVNQ